MPRLPRLVALVTAVVAALLLPAPPAGADELTWTVTTDGVAVNGTYRPIVGDFFGTPNGLDDIIWYAPGVATDHVWRTGESDDAVFTTQVLPRQVKGTYTPIVGNFGGDARDDILWYAPGPAADGLWISDGTTFSAQTLTVNGAYIPAVLDDDSGYDDVIWARPSGGAGGGLWTFHPNGYTAKSITSPVGSRPLTGRFNDGGCADVFWYAPGPVTDEVWYLNCAGVIGAAVDEPITGTFEPVVVDAVVPAANDGILWFRDGAASWYFEGDDVGTWKQDSYDLYVYGDAIAAGSWVHLRSRNGQPDRLLRVPGHPIGGVIDAETPPLAIAHQPVVGRFVMSYLATKDILWYASGATPEMLFYVDAIG